MCEIKHVEPLKLSLSKGLRKLIPIQPFTYSKIMKDELQGIHRLTWKTNERSTRTAGETALW